VTRPTWLWLSLGVSTLAHAAFGWHLSATGAQRRDLPDRDTFDVRMVQLPPPAPPPEPPAPVQPPPAKVEPPRATPKPKPRPEPVPPAPPEAVTEPPPSEPAPEPTSAPPALLAESMGTGGGIVQMSGASIGALATTSRPAQTERVGEVVAAPRSAPFAKLSDLSRKPRAPSLDAALRQNYPPDLRRRGTEGQAEVRVVIDGGGRVEEIAVLSESAPGFAEACRKTLLGSRWSEPLDHDGRAVSTRLTYRCRFEVER
jgi:TonB family protein